MSHDIDSGEKLPSESPIVKSFADMNRAESVRLGKERAMRRMAQAKAQLTKNTMKVIDSAPAAYQDRLVKACLGIASPKVSIRAQCEQCVGYEDVKARVSDCRSFACALHHYRPYKPGKA